jgi:cytidylate kinase
MHAFVVVSGLPASGKTTIAAALASALQFPLLDKDSFLEALFQSEGTGPADWRRTLSKRADTQFQQAAVAAQRAVLASWWKHPRSIIDSGTSPNWLLGPARVVVEVHCACRASVAAARFAARARHPGHLDRQRTSGSILAMLEQQESFGPLFPERAITVSTEVPVDLAVLICSVRSALQEERAS